MENHPKQLGILEKAQLLAGTLLLESFAVASATATINVIENGGPDSALRIGVGALGTIAMAGSGGLMWQQLHRPSQE